jgi:hypothetical protein
MVMAKAVVRGSLISFGLAGALCALATQAVGAPFVVPGSKAAGLESCVEPTDFMRRNHMEVIKHQRDETVHSGIRSTKHSLAGCVECHASTTSEGVLIPVNAPEQFCAACHAFTAVRMDCFGCHASVPAPTPEAAVAAARGQAWHPEVAQTAPGEGAVQPAARGQGN